jgi:hypothetical protein
MGFIVTVAIEGGDECPEFTRNPEFETRDMVFKEVVGNVYAEGVVGRTYLVKLIQQSEAIDTTLLTHSVIPSGLEYALTVQKLSDGYLLVAHPVHYGDEIRHTYTSWDDLQQRLVEHLELEPAELQRAHAEFEKNPFKVLAFEGPNLITASVVAVLCA